MIHCPRLNCIALILSFSIARLTPTAAEPVSESFPPEIDEITITSSLDGQQQKALLYIPEMSTDEESIALLVGLHTWSGDFQQKGSIPMAEWCVRKQWAFVHPNFRGPNWTPNACGSDLAVQDVIDAINHVKQLCSVDETKIHLMGTSGGGHMALLVAGRHPEVFAGVSAWVPITDISAWFYECQAAGRRYAIDMLRSIGAAPHDSEQARLSYARRSPLTWLRNADSVSFDINAGIRDGHEGSVPISHSFVAFNQLAAPQDQISATEILEFTGTSAVPDDLVDSALFDESYGEKQPLFRRTSRKARITIFDGGHEGIPTAGLQWLAKQEKRNH